MKAIFNTLVILVIAIIALELFTNNVAYLTTTTSYTGSPGDGISCTDCHGSIQTNNSQFIITSTIPPTGYVPGTTYDIIVSVIGTGAKIFEVSPQLSSGTVKGTLIAGSGTKLVNSGKDIINSSSTTMNPMGWTFQWTAPAAGTGNVTFYGAASLDKSKIYLAATEVTENGASGLNEQNDNFGLILFPNPAANQLKISYTLKNESRVMIDMINMEGKTVTTLLNDFNGRGTYSKTFMLSNSISDGIYFVRISKENTSIIKKIIIQ